MRIEPLNKYKHFTHDIAKMLHEEWSDLSPWASIHTIENRFNTSSNEEIFPITLLALSDEDCLIGTASVKLLEVPSHPNKVHWLGEVFIPKELRGQGIGSALILFCINYCVNNQVSELFLYTPDQQALYRRFGWVDIDSLEVNGEHVRVMKLDLRK